MSLRIFRTRKGTYTVKAARFTQVRHLTARQYAYYYTTPLLLFLCCSVILEKPYRQKSQTSYIRKQRTNTQSIKRQSLCKQFSSQISYFFPLFALNLINANEFISLISV